MQHANFTWALSHAILLLRCRTCFELRRGPRGPLQGHQPTRGTYHRHLRRRLLPHRRRQAKSRLLRLGRHRQALGPLRRVLRRVLASSPDLGNRRARAHRSSTPPCDTSLISTNDDRTLVWGTRADATNTALAFECTSTDPSTDPPTPKKDLRPDRNGRSNGPSPPHL